MAKVVLESIQDMLLKLALQMARDDYEDRRERQRQGVELAKDAGRYTGRKANKRCMNALWRCAPQATAFQRRPGWPGAVKARSSAYGRCTTRRRRDLLGRLQLAQAFHDRRPLQRSSLASFACQRAFLRLMRCARGSCCRGSADRAARPARVVHPEPF